MGVPCLRYKVQLLFQVAHNLTANLIYCFIDEEKYKVACRYIHFQKSGVQHTGIFSSMVHKGLSPMKANKLNTAVTGEILFQVFTTRQEDRCIYIDYNQYASFKG